MPIAAAEVASPCLQEWEDHSEGGTLILLSQTLRRSLGNELPTALLS